MSHRAAALAMLGAIVAGIVMPCGMAAADEAEDGHADGDGGRLY